MWRTGHLPSPMPLLAHISSFASHYLCWVLFSQGEVMGKASDHPKHHAECGGLRCSDSARSVWASAEQNLCCANCSRSARGALSIWTWTFLEKTGLLPTSKGVWAANIKGNQFLTFWKSGSCSLWTPVSCFCWHPSTHWLTAKRRFHWTCWPCVIDLSTDQPKRLG